MHFVLKLLGIGFEELGGIPHQKVRSAPPPTLRVSSECVRTKGLLFFSGSLCTRCRDKHCIGRRSEERTGSKETTENE